jgi:hypothetical protein
MTTRPVAWAGIPLDINLDDERRSCPDPRDAVEQVPLGYPFRWPEPELALTGVRELDDPAGRPCRRR